MNTELIGQIAAFQRLPPGLIAAIIQVESNGNCWAMRYEPAFFTRYVAGHSFPCYAPCSFDTEAQGRATSWGLMQIMGQVARERGFIHPYLSALCDAETGIDYGCRHVAFLKARYLKGEDWTPVIAAYNAGSPQKIGARYTNQKYVNRVLDAWNR